MASARTSNVRSWIFVAVIGVVLVLTSPVIAALQADSTPILAVSVDLQAVNDSSCFVYNPAVSNSTQVCGIVSDCRCWSLAGAVDSVNMLLSLPSTTSLSVSVCTNSTTCSTMDVPWASYTEALVTVATGTYAGACNTAIAVESFPISFEGLGAAVVSGDHLLDTQFAFRFGAGGNVSLSNLAIVDFPSDVVLEVSNGILSVQNVLVGNILASPETSIISIDSAATVVIRGLSVVDCQVDSIIVTNRFGAEHVDVVGLDVSESRVNTLADVVVRDTFIISNVTLENMSTLEDTADRKVVQVELLETATAVEMNYWRLTNVFSFASAFVYIEAVEQPLLPVASFTGWELRGVSAKGSALLSSRGIASFWESMTVVTASFATLMQVAEGSCTWTDSEVVWLDCNAAMYGDLHAALEMSRVVFRSTSSGDGLVMLADNDPSGRIDVSDCDFDVFGPAIVAFDGSIIVRDCSFSNVADVSVSISSSVASQPALLLNCSFNVTGVSEAVVYSDGHAVIQRCNFTSTASPTAAVFGRQVVSSENHRSVRVVDCTFTSACIIASVSQLDVINCQFDNPVSSTFVDAGSVHPVNSLFATSSMLQLLLVNCTFQNANAGYTAQSLDLGVTPSALEIVSQGSFQLQADIVSCTFLNNYAYKGGALMAKNAGVRISQSLFLYAQPHNAQQHCSQTDLHSGNHAGTGGAVALEGGDVSLTEVVFRDNESIEDGGALWVGFHSQVTASAVVFAENVARSSGGGAYFGATAGGEFENVLFLNCSALSGGGMVTTGESNPTIQDTVFSGCSCSSSGGAVSVQDYSTAKFYNCTVEENTANSYGAGFHISAFSGPAIVDCSVQRNTSPNSGGGIYVQDEATPLIRSTTISYNVAQSVGGGMMFAVNSSGAVTNCRITHNTGRSKGGGVALEDFSHPFFEGTMFARNEATSAGGLLAMDSASPSFSNCFFEHNQALSSGGAALSSDFSNVYYNNCTFDSNHSTFSSGGAVTLSGFSNATFVSSAFMRNSAHGGGGGIFHSSLSPPTIVNSTFVANTAATNGGGAVMLVSASRVFLDSCRFFDNTCQQGSGGGLFSAASNGLSLTNCTFVGNVAVGHGGACFFGSSTLLDLSDSEFHQNNSTESGGALYAESAVVGTISDCLLHANVADSGKGGGAFVSSGGLVSTRVMFSANNATYGGGLLLQPPLELHSYATQFVECVFENNLSFTSGGAVAIELAFSSLNHTETPPITQDDLVCDESSCFSYRKGPAPPGDHGYLRSARADDYAFTSCEFRFNEAFQNGGAVSLDLLTSASNFYEPLFLGNTAHHFGGALFVQVGSASPIVTLGTFDANEAGWAGRNMGFRLVENAAGVDQNVCFECFLGEGLQNTGYNNPKGFATMPSVFGYAENTTCPASLSLDAAPFSIALGLRDAFTTKVVGALLEDTAFVVMYNYTGTNCTVEAESDSGVLRIPSDTGIAAFGNLTLAGKNNSTCELLYSSLPIRGLRLPFENAISENCVIGLNGCPPGEVVVPGSGYDSCEESSQDTNNEVVHIMVAVIFGLLLIVLMLFLCNVALQYQEHKKRAKKAYYAALEIDDEIMVPGNVTLNDVLSDPEITRIPFDNVTMGKRIGFGASGVVSEATWHKPEGDCPVAMKELLVHFSDLDDTAIQEFLVEIKLMSALHHRNVVEFLGIMYHQDRLYLVTELMQYGCLRDLLTKKGSNLSWKLKMKLMIDAAKGMRYLHSKSLIHRDLKPQNLLVNSFWKCKVADFGISTVMTRTRTMTAVGTPVYMAPEVLNNERYSQKADVYSFGIVLAEAFTNRRPYDEHGTLNDAQLLYKIYHDGLRPSLDGLPHNLAELVREAVDENPSMRPSFGEIIERLKRLKRLDVHEGWESAGQGWDSAQPWNSESSALEQEEGLIIMPSDQDLATSMESEHGFLLGATPEPSQQRSRLFGTKGSVNFDP